MAIKLVDELKAMGNFPIAHAEGINLVKTDGTEDNLQSLFDNGELGGGGDSSTTLTQQEYEALSEEQKLNGLYYTYDTKRIYKNGVQYGASDAEDIGYNNAESGIQATTVQGAIDKVVKKVDGLISDTTSSTTSTWSSQKTSSKIAEKIDKTDIATTIDNTVTDEQIASARAVLRSKSATRMDESVNPENYEVGAWFAEGHDSISLSTSDGHPCSEWHIGYVVTGYKASDSNGYKIILAIAMSGNCYIKVQQWDKWTDWKELATMDKVANSIIRESRSTLYNLNNVDNIEVAIDIAKSGYKPIAVSLFNSGTHLWFAQGMYFNDTVCNLSLRGVVPTSATNAECKVLVTYIKTS